MKIIETGVLLPGAIKVNNFNVQDVWRGNVKMHSGKNAGAFVKHVPPRALVVEVVAALIGRNLQLPIPIPLLVKVEPEVLPDSKLDVATIFFGSQRINQPDLAQWLNENAEGVKDRLKSWPLALDAGCFDEWLANEDRHSRNILFDGKKDFVLIDHSHAIPKDLRPNEPAKKNSMLEILSEKTNAKQLDSLRKKAKKNLSSNYNLSELEKLLTMLLNDIKEYESSAIEIANFLIHRLPHLDVLISARLGERQIDFQGVIDGQV